MAAAKGLSKFVVHGSSFADCTGSVGGPAQPSAGIIKPGLWLLRKRLQIPAVGEAKNSFSVSERHVIG